MIDRYGFECEGGPLKNCIEWLLLKQRLLPGFETDLTDESLKHEIDIRMKPIDDRP